jgi:hypothetical protein
MPTTEASVASYDEVFISAVDTCENIDFNRGSCNDVSGRPCVSTEEVLQGRAAILLTFGQSNAANSGDTPYLPRRRVFNFDLFDGRCYVAKDPLLGATENRGNFAGRLGDMLIEHGDYDSVLVAPIAVGGSRIEEWTTGGARHRRLQIAIKRATGAGLTFTHLLWHQGETNATYDPDGDIYQACFMNIHCAVRSYGVGAPIFVAQATIANGPPNETIRRAQRAVVNSSLGILPGPDTDQIGPEHRFDGCHMTESGLIKHAEMWLLCLSNHGSPSAA